MKYPSKVAIELPWFVSGRILLCHPIIPPPSNYACISRGRVEGNPITYLPSPILFADSSCDILLKMWPSFNGWKKTTSQKFSHWWHPGLSPHRLKPIAIRPSVYQLWKASPSIDSEVSHLKFEQRIFFFVFLYSHPDCRSILLNSILLLELLVRLDHMQCERAFSNCPWDCWFLNPRGLVSKFRCLFFFFFLNQIYCPLWFYHMVDIIVTVIYSHNRYPVS